MGVTSSLNPAWQSLTHRRDSREDRATWKSNSFLKIIQLLDDYLKCFIVGADNAGSEQMQQIRMSLRGKAVKLLPHIRGNVGFACTKEDLTAVRDMLLANKGRAAARAGAIAPCEVTALGITTNISRGTIENLSDVLLIFNLTVPYTWAPEH
ncbi:hypothetical protein QTO34_014953 [Cnephaeus nilssonii]|uniref:Large ribosomal subunit protein uL10 n=1 Tax=Cnephaeus nilssonii TaxID=3371016 RepID=A0AA40LSD8_CNENI|nr:hypothetical protein QTO34_014953 [Eptesicus nilssonii]